MKKVLIIVQSPVSRDARVLRQIEWLRDDYEIYLLAEDRPTTIKRTNFYRLSSFKEVTFGRMALIFQSIISRTKYSKHYSYVNYYHRKAVVYFSKIAFDCVICNDVNTLPIGVFFKTGNSNIKLIFDDHEYAPTEHEGNVIWEILHKPINISILDNFLKYADKVLTIGDCLAEQYFNKYKVKPVVILNAPNFVTAEIPQSRAYKELRIIHHGVVSKDRAPGIMLNVMKYLNDSFSLTLMVFGNKSIMSRLQRNAKVIEKKIFFKKTVPTTLIVETLSDFDLGICILPPVNFTNLCALPNKFFDFIQARLPIVIGPSVEMQRIIDKYNIGVVAKSFDPKDIAQSINSITPEMMLLYRINLNLAAQEICAENNRYRFLQVIRDLI